MRLTERMLRSIPQVSPAKHCSGCRPHQRLVCDCRGDVVDPTVWRNVEAAIDTTVEIVEPEGKVPEPIV